MLVLGAAEGAACPVDRKQAPSSSRLACRGLLLEAISAPGHAYSRLPARDLLAFAQGDSVNPSSPLRRGLTFLAAPELQRRFSAGARHLELGCGIGGGTLSILNTYPNVAAVGVELQTDLLAFVRILQSPQRGRLLAQRPLA
jgi:hypothetical protein